MPRSPSLWYLPGSSTPAFQDYTAIQDTFGALPRLLDVVVEAKNGGDVLPFLGAASQVHFSVLGLITREGRVTYPEVCEPEAGSGAHTGGGGVAAGIGDCRRATLFDGALAAFPSADAVASAVASGDALAAINAAAATGSWGVTLGGVLYDPSTGLVASARALRCYYYLREEGDDEPRPLSEAAARPAMQRLLKFEMEFLCRILGDGPACAELGSDGDDGSDGDARPWRGEVKVSGFAKRSIDDEVARNVSGSTVFMVLSINLILLLMAMSLGGKPCKRSRVLLACGSVATILLSEAVGFGLAGWFGVPFTDITLMLVFIAVRKAVFFGGKCGATGARRSCVSYPHHHHA